MEPRGFNPGAFFVALLTSTTPLPAQTTRRKGRGPGEYRPARRSSGPVAVCLAHGSSVSQQSSKTTSAPTQTFDIGSRNVPGGSTKATWGEPSQFDSARERCRSLRTLGCGNTRLALLSLRTKQSASEQPPSQLIDRRRIESEDAWIKPRFG